jgi:hypothetical protein
MSHNQELRKQLTHLLAARQAHVDFSDAVDILRNPQMSNELAQHFAGKFEFCKMSSS